MEALESAPSPEVARILDEDEVVLLVLAPSLWFVPLASLGSIAAIACVTLGMAWLSRFPAVHWSDAQAFLLGGFLVGMRLAWQMLEWSMRVYVLTDRRVLRLAGIVSRRCDQALLKEIRHTTLLATPRERALDVGTLLFAAAVGHTGSSSGSATGFTAGFTLGSTASPTAGSPAALAWETIRRPQHVLGAVRDAIERYGG
ncbi:MAG TPA: hypothetical protein PKC43_02565 [Phycisphaerales bacterium]|nr:hypothetical protein [Phycisphaerales bacterium]HMP36309.1 hypothetical protein [Phycisphaerales bacterium]